MRSLKRSNAHFKKALTRLPLGVCSSFRYWGDDRTIYARRGEGARIWDIDDNEYIDYRLGYGPAILGYRHPQVDQAAREAIDVGGVFALATEREFSVADRIAGLVPSVDLVRFSNSGTEAVMAALRIARAYSRRDGYILVEGGYHGMSDSVQWQASDSDIQEGRDDVELVSYGRGVPKVLKSLIHLVPLNDIEWLEEVLRDHGDEIGALLIEPIMGNCCSITADPEYVHAARQLCDRYGVVMIVDEVKTGFRVARGGVQELMGIRADLSTFAKSIANGYPVAAVAGREEIMRLIRPGGVQHGGTYTGHAVGMAAAEKTLEILGETDALERVENYGKRMQDGMSSILSRRGVAHVFAGHPSMFGLFFAEKSPTNYRDWADSDYTFYIALARQLHERGILCEPDSREPWFISAAHDDACLDETLVKFEQALDATLEASRSSG